MNNPSERSTIAIAMGVKDDIEAIDINLRHHLQLGFDLIYVMDFRSTDGTREVLQSWADHPQIRVSFDDSTSPDNRHLQQALRLQVYENPEVDFVLHIDPDEFLLVREGTDIHDLFSLDGPDVHYIMRRNLVPIPQFVSGISDNMIKKLPSMFLFNGKLHNDHQLMTPTTENALIRWLLAPPKAKVLHRTVPIRLNMGFHAVQGPLIQRCSCPGDVGLVHIPLTSLQRYETKLRNIEDSLTHAAHLYPSGTAHHWKQFLDGYRTGIHQQVYASVIHSRDRLIKGAKSGIIVPAIHLLRRDTVEMPIDAPFNRLTSYSLQGPGVEPI